MTLHEHLGDTGGGTEIGVDLESAAIEEVAGQATHDVMEVLVSTIPVSRTGPQGYSPGPGPSARIAALD